MEEICQQAIEITQKYRKQYLKTSPQKIQYQQVMISVDSTGCILPFINDTRNNKMLIKHLWNTPHYSNLQGFHIHAIRKMNLKTVFIYCKNWLNSPPLRAKTSIYGIPGNRFVLSY